MRGKEQLPSPVRLRYGNHSILLSQTREPYLTLSFDDHSKFVHYSCTKELQHISYRTVLAALEGREQSVVQAHLQTVGQDYHLIITVNYEFLHPIQEIFVLKGEKMSEEKIRAAKVEKLSEQAVAKLKQELKSISRSCCLGGKLSNTARKVQEIMMQFPYPLTSITISLNLSNSKSTLLKTQFDYYDQPTRTKIPTNFFPEEEVFTMGSSEFTFVVDRNDFEKGIFSFSGDFDHCDYIVTYESVQDARPKVVRPHVRAVMLFVCLTIAYWGFRWLTSSQDSEL